MAYAVVLIALLTSAGHAQTIINTQESVVGGNLSKTVKTVQFGDGPLNRFLMSRVVKPVPNNAIKGVFFLLPPLGSGFQNYEVGDNGDYQKSLVGFLAERNIAVYGISQRVQGIAAGTCESGAADCSVMSAWDMQRMVDDATFVRQQIELDYPDHKVVVGGLSLGSILSMALINNFPNDYDGAVLIEGTLHYNDPVVQAINANFCTALNGMLAGGVFYDGQGGPGIKLLSQLAQSAPNAPTPIPGFPPGLTNHQAFVLALSAPPLSPLAPRPGYANLAGSVFEDRFFFANEALVHANLAEFVDYATTLSLKDLSCGLAGDTTFTGNLGNFTGKVLMFGGGKAFGPGMLDTAQLMSSANVTINYRADYGHVDFVFSDKHLQQVEHPIFKWLDEELFHQ